jgi:hypothetical protein
MKYQSVNSSNISEIGHSDDTLGIRFKSGKEYHFFGVSKLIYTQLLSSASVGRTFNMLIKSNPDEYPFRQVV